MNVTKDEDLLEAKTRLTNAQADMKELQLAALRKEYVKVEEVRHKWEEQASRVRGKMLSIPVRLAGILSGKERDAEEIEVLVQELVNEALMELAGGYEDDA